MGRVPLASCSTVCSDGLSKRYKMADSLQVELETDNSSQSSDPESSGESVGSTVSTPQLQTNRPFVVCIEGNIGSGKSTMLRYFQNSSSNAEVVMEPIEEWTNFNGHNALAKLYEDSERWSFSFNTCAALKRLEMHTTVTDKPVVMLERSLFSLRYCFVENDSNGGRLHGLEYAILTRWFEYLLSRQYIPIDLFVYLRVDPEKCYERLRARDREEEMLVPPSLIEELHNVHESWLMDNKFPVPAPVLVLDANTDIAGMEVLYEQHRSSILIGHR